MNSNKMKFIVVASSMSLLVGAGWWQELSNAAGLRGDSVGTLITEAEARLPRLGPHSPYLQELDDTPVEKDFRLPSMAKNARCNDPPKIVVKSPTNGSSVKRPLQVEVEFQPCDTSNPIDIDSFSLHYMVDPPKDLTDRVKSYVTPRGISDQLWMVPSGDFWLRLKVKSQRGGSAIADVRFKIS